jgi:hypothetical protein
MFLEMPVRSLHRSQAVEERTRSVLSHSEPLPERLYSAKIPRAPWLVGFSGYTVENEKAGKMLSSETVP